MADDWFFATAADFFTIRQVAQPANAADKRLLILNAFILQQNNNKLYVIYIYMYTLSLS